MPQTTANGIAIEYEDHGDPENPPLLLVMGLGGQLTLWPIELVEAFVERGFRVIRYDNRDIGLSHKFDGEKAPGPIRNMLMTRIGRPPRVPYTVADMAGDGIGLLDALEIPAAHIVGASLGGMIAQHIAFTHPERVLSLTSVMSTTGNPRLPAGKWEATKVLLKRPQAGDEDTLVEHGIRIAHAIGSPGYRPDPERLRTRVRANLQRSFYPAGPARQLAAAIADGDRRQRLKRIAAPTLVIHGEEDPLIPVAAGRDTAKSIPGAKLETIAGWGHDLPLELVDRLADSIADHAKGAEAA